MGELGGFSNAMALRHAGALEDEIETRRALIVCEGASQQLKLTALEHEAERALALRLLQFDTAVWDTLDKYSPHRLCTYLYDLASEFSSFYKSLEFNSRRNTETLCDTFNVFKIAFVAVGNPGIGVVVAVFQTRKKAGLEGIHDFLDLFCGGLFSVTKADRP